MVSEKDAGEEKLQQLQDKLNQEVDKAKDGSVLLGKFKSKF